MAALWRTKAWRLFPLLLVYMSGTALLDGRGGRAEASGRGVGAPAGHAPRAASPLAAAANLPCRLSPFAQASLCWCLMCPTYWQITLRGGRWGTSCAAKAWQQTRPMPRYAG